MAKEQRGINYRTITPQGMVALDTSGSAAQRGAQTGFAIGAQIRARIDAARAIEKANQAAKDKWRDSQMATITDTSFVDKVDPSIHEGAFTWLKGKQQEYGDVLDALSAEGMNSKNPAWEQEIRKGMREDPKYITCRRYKRRKAKNGQEVCLYKGANDTYSLVVEGHCPVEYQCKYEPGGTEPNIDSVVDSLNDSFK